MDYLSHLARVALVCKSWILFEDGYSIQAHLNPYPLQNPLHPRRGFIGLREALPEQEACSSRRIRRPR